MPSLVPLGRYRITFEDGSTEEVQSNFGAIMELERILPGDDTPPATTLATGIWLYMGKPADDCEKWAGTVLNIEPLENEDADPSPPAAGAD